jgi:hypothetical protein
MQSVLHLNDSAMTLLSKTRIQMSSTLLKGSLVYTMAFSESLARADDTKL